MRTFLKIAVGVAAVAGLATASTAGTATANIGVTATVGGACTFTASTLTFGSYVTTANSDANATVTPNCLNGTAWTIALGAGAGTGATATTRKLTSGANTLDYKLYSDSSHTLNWGNTTDTVTGTGSGGTQPQTVYGRIASGLSPAAGNYTDTVIATITF
jgi:spore coat protein U-like protein